ncbi:hypothetical protein D3C75_701060 [compost metagenome]
MGESHLPLVIHELTVRFHFIASSSAYRVPGKRNLIALYLHLNVARYTQDGGSGQRFTPFASNIAYLRPYTVYMPGVGFKVRMLIFG